jgi:hypothetical protein
MALPAALLTNTCDIYRPFGDATPLATGIPCRLAPDLAGGSGKKVVAALIWTHILDFQPGADVRDGCSRTAGTNAIDFADGDEVRVPGGAGTTRYVVVWVETVGLGTTMQYQRAYLLRHEAAWPDP